MLGKKFPKTMYGRGRRFINGDGRKKVIRSKTSVNVSIRK